MNNEEREYRKCIDFIEGKKEEKEARKNEWLQN